MKQVVFVFDSALVLAFYLPGDYTVWPFASLVARLTMAAIHRTSTFFLFLLSMLRSRELSRSGSMWIPAETERERRWVSFEPRRGRSFT